MNDCILDSVHYQKYLNIVLGNEFLSAEKASAEFRTSLWKILATPLIIRKTLLSLSITCTIVTNIKHLAHISDTLMQVQYKFKILFALCQGTCM